MGRAKRKDVKFSRTPHPAKRPRTVEEIDYRKHSIHWSFKAMDVGIDWSDGSTSIPKFADVAVHMKGYEGMKWAQIEANRKKNHSVSVEKIISKAQKRLRQLKLDDRDFIFSLHFQGKWRLWGFRAGWVYNVLWWDPDHVICPSKMKHT